jgi:hypothetical protein
MYIILFLALTPYIVVERYKRFGGTCVSIFYTEGDSRFLRNFINFLPHRDVVATILWQREMVTH